MDCILCATMANDSVELRHYSSRRHIMDRKILVRLLNKTSLSEIGDRL